MFGLLTNLVDRRAWIAVVLAVIIDATGVYDLQAPPLMKPAGC